MTAVTDLYLYSPAQPGKFDTLFFFQGKSGAMAKIIIGVHGLGNKPPQKVLQRSWKNALSEGFTAFGYPRIPFRLQLVHWSDLVYPEPLDPNETDRESPLYDDEPYVPATTFMRKEPSPLREKVLRYLDKQMKSLFLNSDGTINFASVTELIIHHFFRELDLYYCTTCIISNKRHILVKDLIHERLTRILRQNRNNDILLIAHSMGSIIAYDVLSQCAPDVTVDTFVTIGSPLGIPVVLSKLASERKKSGEKGPNAYVPESIAGNWYNGADLEDNMTINYQLSDDFKENSRGVRIIDRIVSNNYEYEGKKNPHKSYGYLRTLDMTEIIHAFLNRGHERGAISVS